MNKFLRPRTVRLRLSVKSSRKSRSPQPQTPKTRKLVILIIYYKVLGFSPALGNSLPRRLGLARFVVKNKQEMNEFFSGIIPKCANVLPLPTGPPPHP